MTTSVTGPRLLGINYSGLHDSSVAILAEDGSIPFAISEERISRYKGDGRFPFLALSRCPLARVEALCVPYLRDIPTVATTPKELIGIVDSVPGHVTAHSNEWRKSFDRLGLPVLYFDHHESHAAAGFFLSGFREAVIVTADAGADNCTWHMAAFHADSSGISLIEGTSIADSIPLARWYADVTAMLGFRPVRDEGKVTALAAHAPYNEKCQMATLELLRRHSLQALLDQNEALYRWRRFPNNDEPPCLVINSEVAKRLRVGLSRFSDADVARALQDILERRIVSFISRHASVGHGDRPVVLSGGLFANVKLNQVIARLIRGKMFVCPAMGDEGLAIGAAVLGAASMEGRWRAKPRRHSMFLGTRPNIGNIPTDRHLVATRPGFPGPSLARTVSELLAKGKQVALVRGPMEFGPRALGHRSVLSPATDHSYAIRLNKRLHRDQIMPFSPAILERNLRFMYRDQRQAFGVEPCLPYMTISIAVSDEFWRMFPAVVHVDGTCRPQSVEDDVLAEILERYEELTGSFALINTSFNMHGEPIVRSTKGAFRSFQASGLDALVLEDVVLVRNEKT